MSYKSELCRAMGMLADNPKTIFIGQNTVYSGNSIYATLKDIPNNRKIETPVFEETQMGMSIGLAMAGFIPVSVYPRFDFLILATNQLVNHLDKMEKLSHGQFKPKVIIRTLVGCTHPFDPGVQHCQNHTTAYASMLTNCDVIELKDESSVFQTYVNALKSERSTLIVENESLF